VSLCILFILPFLFILNSTFSCSAIFHTERACSVMSLRIQERVKRVEFLKETQKRGMELLHKNESLGLFYVRTCGG
jgi:hypothetical protein